MITMVMEGRGRGSWLSRLVSIPSTSRGVCRGKGGTTTESLIPLCRVFLVGLWLEDGGRGRKGGGEVLIRMVEDNSGLLVGGIYKGGDAAECPGP